MKRLLAATILICAALSSCVFDSPFEPEAKIPVNRKWLGLWEQQASPVNSTPDRMLVLESGPNDCIVQFPLGDEAMVFRAFAIQLGGKEYLQVQLIGDAGGAAKKEDRKFNLFTLSLDGDTLEMKAIDAKKLGDGPLDTDQLKTAFLAHQDDPELFVDPVTFKRLPRPE